MIPYASLSLLRARLGLALTGTDADPATGENPRYLHALRTATATLDRYTHRRFTPQLATYTFDYRHPYQVRFGGETLLSLQLLESAGNVIPSTAVQLAGGTLAYGLDLDTTQAQFTYLSTPRNAIRVTGLWGYHPCYAEAWMLIDLLNGNLNDTQTTLTVFTDSNLDPYTYYPLYQPGMLIRIDTEYLEVQKINTTTNTVTVRRAVNGTTAAAHIGNTPVYRYTPPEEITGFTLRVAAWLLKQAEAGDFGDHTGTDFMGQVRVGSTLPEDVTAGLAIWRRV
jgi:hypothetical protein